MNVAYLVKRNQYLQNVMRMHRRKLGLVLLWKCFGNKRVIYFLKNPGMFKRVDTLFINEQRAFYVTFQKITYVCETLSFFSQDD